MKTNEGYFPPSPQSIPMGLAPYPKNSGVTNERKEIESWRAVAEQREKEILSILSTHVHVRDVIPLLQATCVVECSSPWRIPRQDFIDKHSDKIAAEFPNTLR